MRFAGPLPVLATAGQGYALLWRHRWLHAKAIWPPVLFLVTAEFLYHRVVGNADGFSSRWHAMLAAPLSMPLGAAASWLAGLKFLLSFSISWRRHLLLREGFDPFFFKAPFWRYLGFLLLTYAWAVPLVLLCLVPAGLLAAWHAQVGAALAAVALGGPACAVVVWGIVRQVPYFSVLALGLTRPGWRQSVGAMRGSVARYLAAFVLAMAPVVAANFLLDLGLKHFGADRHSVHVALAESAFRQAMLFVHFSLGASIGAMTTVCVMPGLGVRAARR